MEIITDDPELDFYTLNRELDRAKSQVFLGKSAAFLGPLMCSLDFVWTRSIETAATDGVRFYWNPADFLRCCAEERKSTILHELWHVARLHMLRRGDRCPQIWNVACDVKINRDDLKNQGYFIGPDWINRPDITLDMEEDIYDLLAKPGSPKLPDQFHFKDDMLPMDPTTQQKAVNNVVRAMTAAKMADKAGDIPGDVEQVISKFLTPIIPWHVQLQRWFTDMIHSGWTFRKPNRRYHHMYLPSIDEEEGRLDHIIVYEDVSGSVNDDETLRFNSEVKYIKDTFNPKKLTLVQFDTRITKEVTLTEDQPFEEVVIVGRGGTCLRPVREHMMKHRPTAAIVFSDLYVEPMEPGPTNPIVWVVVNNKNAEVPFGKKIHINV